MREIEANQPQSNGTGRATVHSESLSADRPTDLAASVYCMVRSRGATPMSRTVVTMLTVRAMSRDVSLDAGIGVF